jgi:hypothetical protein
MNCPSCNQPYEDGATVCPNCGAPLLSTTPAPPAPVAPPPPPTTPAYLPPFAGPSSNGMAKASLVLGIIGVALVVLVFVVALFVGGGLTSLSPEDIQTYAQAGGLAVTCVGVGFLASPVVGLLGLVVGIVALNREKTQPTRRGRTQAIVGIVLSCIPLLCCLTMVVLYIVGVSAISGLVGR